MWKNSLHSCIHSVLFGPCRAQTLLQRKKGLIIFNVVKGFLTWGSSEAWTRTIAVRSLLSPADDAGELGLDGYDGDQQGVIQLAGWRNSSYTKLKSLHHVILEISKTNYSYSWPFQVFGSQRLFAAVLCMWLLQGSLWVDWTSGRCPQFTMCTHIPHITRTTTQKTLITYHSPCFDWPLLWR